MDLPGDESDMLRARTLYNVKHSDFTFLFVPFANKLTAGSKLTVKYLQQHRKPYLLARIARTKSYELFTEDGYKKPEDPSAMVVAYLKESTELLGRPQVNVAGSRTMDQKVVMEELGGMLCLSGLTRIQSR